MSVLLKLLHASGAIEALNIPLGHTLTRRWDKCCSSSRAFSSPCCSLCCMEPGYKEAHAVKVVQASRGGGMGWGVVAEDARRVGGDAKRLIAAVAASVGTINGVELLHLLQLLHGAWI